jgi:GTP-binding protein Era
MDVPLQMPKKSGFVAIMGRPNVGKSTLINGLLGQKVSAVSPRPQTTRKRQLGILTLDRAQIIFVDTPGVHHPRHKLGESMNRVAREALADSDLVLFMVDASEMPNDDDRLLARLVADLNCSEKALLILNKIDLVDPKDLPGRQAAYQELLPLADALLISALRGDNRESLQEAILDRLPEGPLYYPEDQVTDFYERDIVADLIREAALIHLREEVPHGIAIRIDDYVDRGEHTAYIAATLFIERESHKAIVIGQGGTMLKKIGSTARQQIEALTQRKVFLELRIRVRKSWRDDENALQSFGF